MNTWGGGVEDALRDRRTSRGMSGFRRNRRYRGLVSHFRFFTDRYQLDCLQEHGSNWCLVYPSESSDTPENICTVTVP